MVPCCPSRGQLYTKMASLPHRPHIISLQLASLLMPWLARVRQEGHLVTRVVTPRLSPEGIKSEASLVQLGYSHARVVPLAPG
jgi:hypothetical protein